MLASGESLGVYDSSRQEACGHVVKALDQSSTANHLCSYRNGRFAFADGQGQSNHFHRQFGRREEGDAAAREVTSKTALWCKARSCHDDSIRVRYARRRPPFFVRLVVSTEPVYQPGHCLNGFARCFR